MHGSNNFAFIDGANLHITYEYMDWKLDYQKLRCYLTKKYSVTVAYYFIGNTGENDLYTHLDVCNYTVKFKSPSSFTEEEEGCPYCKKVITPEIHTHKSDRDSFMTLRIIEEGSQSLYDKAVLITSDGDFDEVVKWLLRKDKLQIVLAPCRDGCSRLLKDITKGQIAFIDDLREELELIEPAKI